MAAVTVEYDALHFHMRSLKGNIFKVLFREGEGHTKRVLTAIMFEIASSITSMIFASFTTIRSHNGFKTPL